MTPLQTITTEALREFDELEVINHDVYFGCYQGSDWAGEQHLKNFAQATQQLKNLFSHHLSLAYEAGVEEGRDKIDHSIDVRYEQDLEGAFNKFIKKWCGSYYSHLIDDDENDGEFMREKIRSMKLPTPKTKEER